MCARFEFAQWARNAQPRWDLLAGGFVCECHGFKSWFAFSVEEVFDIELFRE